MQQKSTTQIDYTAYEVGNQLRIALECDARIPKDDPVRLLRAALDMATVSTDGTKTEANAKVAEQLPGLLAKAGIKYRLPEEIAVRHLK